MARPAVETRITGRRPCWSDSEPMTGEARNCISAHRATNTPLMMPARALEPVNCSMSVGSTGMTMPIERTSSIAVTRMNAIAALLARKATGDMRLDSEVAPWWRGVRGHERLARWANPAGTRPGGQGKRGASGGGYVPHGRCPSANKGRDATRRRDACARRRVPAFMRAACVSAQFAPVLGVQPLGCLRRCVVAQPREQAINVVPVPQVGALVLV